MNAQRGRDPAPEPPYTGPLGVTRRDAVLLPSTEGSAKRADVVRQVNTLTDPLLARQCLDGTLHRVGEHDLAVPFLYHDPAARRFALVVPAARAHEELTLRAELLGQLAHASGDALPAYVREARTVVGPAGLRRLLDEQARTSNPGPDPRIDAQMQALTQREEKLHKRAQEITRREDDLAAAQSDLAAREEELDRRMAEVLSREETLLQDEQVMRANMAALSSRESRLDARDDEIDARARDFEGRASVVVEASPADSSGEALTAHPPASDSETTGEHRARPVADEALEVDVDDLSVAPAPASDDAMPDDVLPGNAVDMIDEVRADERPRSVAHGDRAYAVVVEGEVRVWFQGTAEIAQQLGAGAVVPVLQADPAGALPTALLSVRGEQGSPVYTRVALDVTRPEDRAVLESLARDFRVRAEVVSPAGRALGGSALGAPCEQNAQRVLELLLARPAASAEAHQAEMNRLLVEGVVLREGADAALSFTDDHALSTAAGVEGALAAYEPLLDRAHLERFVIARGVSLSQVDSFGKRLGLAALRCGVTPSPAFVRRALELGVAPDERALVTRALTAYARTVEGGVASIGRNPQAASRAWEPLLAWAARAGVSLPDAARSAIASLYDPDDPTSLPPPDARTAPSAEAYATMGESELVGWVGHPEARLRAARELARRDAAKNEAAISKALRMLPAAQAAELAAEILRGGDALGDVWVELLGSRRRAVAAIATAGAGVLKLRRALSALVTRALARDNQDWKLAAWAVGEFGVAAVRAVARAETDQPERLAWILGHAIRCGAAKEIERTRADGTKAFQQAATRALALQDEVRAWDEALRRGDGEIEHMVHRVVTRAQGHASEAPEPVAAGAHAPPPEMRGDS